MQNNNLWQKVMTRPQFGAAELTRYEAGAGHFGRHTLWLRRWPGYLTSTGCSTKTMGFDHHFNSEITDIHRPKKWFYMIVGDIVCHFTISYYRHCQYQIPGKPTGSQKCSISSYQVPSYHIRAYEFAYHRIPLEFAIFPMPIQILGFFFWIQTPSKIYIYIRALGCFCTIQI